MASSPIRKETQALRNKCAQHSDTIQKRGIRAQSISARSLPKHSKYHPHHYKNPEYHGHHPHPHPHLQPHPHPIPKPHPGKKSGVIPLKDDIVANGAYPEDVEYYGPAFIGTPAQTFQFDFGTGSSDIWIPSVQIPGSAGNEKLLLLLSRLENLFQLLMEQVKLMALSLVAREASIAHMSFDEEASTIIRNGSVIGLENISKEIEIEKNVLSSVSLPELEEGLQWTVVEGSQLIVLSFTCVPLHRLDPLCFPRGQKVFTTILAAVLVMNTALASSVSSGASPFIEADLGGDPTLVLSAYLVGFVVGPFAGAPTSEAYGRRIVFLLGTGLYTLFSGACALAPNFGSLLILRLLAGIFGSVPTTNSGAVCGDLWNPKERGTAMAFYSVATFAGPALGPLIGAFSSIRWGSWRYEFVILTIFSSILCILVYFSCPETYPPIIIRNLAIQMRKVSGDERITSKLEMEEQATKKVKKVERIKKETIRVLGTPFVMLFSELIVGLLTLYMAIAYGLIYILFAAFPIIFDHLGPGYSSLPFLATLVGAVLSVPVSLFYQRRYVSEVEKVGHSVPEQRLNMCQHGGILVVLSFLWLGWGGNSHSTPWIIPASSGVIQGIASILIFRSLQTYMLDAYERNAASALAANVVARSIFGASFPLFAPALFAKLGIGWACTFLAGLMSLMVPIPFLFEKYGAQIRKRSRFAPGR